MVKGAAIFGAGATFGAVVGGFGGLLCGIAFMISELDKYKSGDVHSVTNLAEQPKRAV